MWKKDEAQTDQATDTPRTTSVRSSSPGRAVIGPSISIRGDVTGSEDLLIQGKVDGSVDLGAHMISVGGDGRVNADVRGRVITIEGQVEGDLIAKEQIILRGSARVLGDIKAPRVVLEDGATFRGLVDMGALDETDAKGASKSKGAATSSKDRPKDEAGESSTGDDKVAASDKDGASASKAGNGVKSDGNGVKSARPTGGATTSGAGDRKGDSASQARA